MQGQLFNSETKSQEARILQYLQSGKQLTHLEAERLFGCARLGARAHALKKQGHKIEREMIKVAPRKWVARYRLEAQ